MYYGLVYYPDIESEPIDRIRRRHDPTVDLIEPHITVMFPVPDSVGEQRLIDHLEIVLTHWRPFRIRLGGLQKSHDHWLLLTLVEGKSDVVRLHRDIHTGVLAGFLRRDMDFVPHLALGLFLKEGARYDCNHPQESDFDASAYRMALPKAEGLQPGSPCVVDKLHLVALADDVIEWAEGKRRSFSAESRAVCVRTFRLDQDAA